MAGTPDIMDIPSLPDSRVLVVEARYHTRINDLLVAGVRGVLEQAGARIEHLVVPGALEIPPAIRIAAELDARIDAFVALGCVIRGETTHYDYVCGESARALLDLSTRYSRALGYGILTCENRDQAWARAGIDEGNKGAAAANACLDMIGIKNRLGLYPR